MGWKASFIVANARAPGYLGTFPAHDPVRARALVKGLFPGRAYRSAGSTTFETGLYPPHDALAIGAYDGAAIVAGWEAGAALRADHPLVAGLAAHYPAAAILTVVLLSATNSFAYAYFEQGVLRRAHAGSADDGVDEDRGPPLPAERPLLATATVRGGRRVFALDGAEYTVDQIGESLAFAVATPFFGVPLDAFDGWDLPMEAFAPRLSRWRRLLHRLGTGPSSAG